MKIQSLFIILLVLFSTNSYSVFRVGNGGDVLVCQNRVGHELDFVNVNSETESVTLLDLYSGYKRWNRTYKTFKNEVTSSSNDNYTVDNVIDKIVLRLKKFSPKRAENLLKLYKQLKSDLRDQRIKELRLGGPFDLEVIRKTILTDIRDSYHIGIPDGCKLEQVIIQFPVKDFPEENSFYFNTVYWDKMDAVNKAATVLHELLVYENYYYNPENTTGVRYLLSTLLSDRYASEDSFKSFYSYLKNARFYKTDIDGDQYPLAICRSRSQSQKTRATTSYYDACEDLQISDLSFEFRDDGSIAKLEIPYTLFSILRSKREYKTELVNTYGDKNIEITNFYNVSKFVFKFKNNHLKEISTLPYYDDGIESYFIFKSLQQQQAKATSLSF